MGIIHKILNVQFITSIIGIIFGSILTSKINKSQYRTQLKIECFKSLQLEIFNIREYYVYQLNNFEDIFKQDKNKHLKEDLKDGLIKNFELYSSIITGCNFYNNNKDNNNNINVITKIKSSVWFLKNLTKVSNLCELIKTLEENCKKYEKYCLNFKYNLETWEKEKGEISKSIEDIIGNLNNLSMLLNSILLKGVI